MASSILKVEVKHNNKTKYKHGHFEGESALDQNDPVKLRVLVHGQNVSWQFHRGFNEFTDVQSELHNRFPNAGLDRYQLNYHQLTTLDELFAYVLSVTEIASSEEVKVFLCMEQNKEKKDLNSFPELTNPTQEEGVNSSDQDTPGSSSESDDARLKLKDYKFVTWLGNGGYGAVALVKRIHDGKALAMKIIVKDDTSDKDTKEHAENEKSFLLQLEHPFIIKMICTFHTEAKFYLVLDFASGGDLFFHIHKTNELSSERARFYAAEIVSALEYLHNQNIVYRDLKPENLLVGPDGHILLADFGMCKTYKPDEVQIGSSQSGTAEYFAPEILIKKPYNHCVDWWAFGVILYEMSFSVHPLKDKEKCIQRFSIKKSTPTQLEKNKGKFDD